MQPQAPLAPQYLPAPSPPRPVPTHTRPSSQQLYLCVPLPLTQGGAGRPTWAGRPCAPSHATWPLLREPWPPAALSRHLLCPDKPRRSARRLPSCLQVPARAPQGVAPRGAQAVRGSREEVPVGTARGRPRGEAVGRGLWGRRLRPRSRAESGGRWDDVGRGSRGPSWRGGPRAPGVGLGSGSSQESPARLRGCVRSTQTRDAGSRSAGSRQRVGSRVGGSPGSLGSSGLGDTRAAAAMAVLPGGSRRLCLCHELPAPASDGPAGGGDRFGVPPREGANRWASGRGVAQLREGLGARAPAQRTGCPRLRGHGASRVSLAKPAPPIPPGRHTGLAAAVTVSSHPPAAGPAAPWTEAPPSTRESCESRPRGPGWETKFSEMKELQASPSAALTPGELVLR